MKTIMVHFLAEVLNTGYFEVETIEESLETIKKIHKKEVIGYCDFTGKDTGGINGAYLLRQIAVAKLKMLQEEIEGKLDVDLESIADFVVNGVIFYINLTVETDSSYEYLKIDMDTTAEEVIEMFQEAMEEE